jgi:DNA mismatch repair protein MutL
MKNKIQILRDEVINKIAAGEIIEHPANIIKELIENSIDAESDEIIVEIGEDCTRRLSVTDNGFGMDQDEIDLALTRHATSKLKEIADINRLASFGFRGEALPSIASVSKIIIDSRENGSLEGTRVIVESGKIFEKKSIACPIGTKIEIENLFDNIPARKKFLKSSSYENTILFDMLYKLIIPHINIKFIIKRENKGEEIFPKSKNYFERIARIFSSCDSENFIKVNEELRTIKIIAWLSNQNQTRSNAKNLITFVNNRLIYDRSINHAILEGYREIIPRDRYPYAIILLYVPHENVDVNVHPSKSEVRFLNPKEIHSFVYGTIKKYLKNKNIWISNESKLEKNITYNFNPINHTINYPNYSQNKVFQDYKPDFKLLGQFHDSYILCEKQDTLYFFDQHALAERITYENLKKEYLNGKIKSQYLTLAVSIKLNSGINIELVKKELEKYGFIIDVFGEDTVVVRAIPLIIKKEDSCLDLIKELYENLEQDKNNYETEHFVNKILYTIACHNSIRANKKLTDFELINMLKELNDVDYNSSCPHGRPICIEFKKDEIERLFYRK